MSRVLPILFNTDMVQEILDGRKTVTRRVVKSQQLIGILPDKCKNGMPEEFLKEKKFMFKPYCDMTDAELIKTSYNPPYHTDDVLYVRETWEHFDCCSCEGDEHGNCPKEQQKSVLDKYGLGCYMYRASDEIWGDAKWHPSIHMPKEAARIWLKVTDVRVERLQEMKPVDAIKEGAYPDCLDCINTYGESGSQCCYGTEEQCSQCDEVMMEWEKLWNSTIKKSDLDLYVWDTSPWVWVIEFERCEKPENA